MKVKTTGSKLPHAWVVSPNDKGRRKIYKDEKIYLNKGEEFEIELYNPTQNNTIALINLDGKPISSSGLIVRPGERFYLDCFIDEKKKFIFDTYEVEDTNEIKNAISKNGLLEVYFYNEEITERVDLTKIINTPREHHHHHHYYPDRWFQPYYNSNIIYGTCNTTSTGTYNSTTNSISLSSDVHSDYSNISGGIETGQTIKGNDSSQIFNEIETCFKEEHISSVTYTLLPESRIPKDSKDVSKSNMNKVSDRLSEGADINDLTSRLYTFNDLKNNELIEEEEFQLIRDKTTNNILSLSEEMSIKYIDDLGHYINTFGDLYNIGIITRDEFNSIKSNLFNSID